MVYPDGFAVTYIWDEDDRLANIQITGQTWAFTYDKDHRPTAARHPNGLELNATYDDASRLTALRSRNKANGSLVEGCNYTYDRTVNRETQGQEANSTALSFDYYADYSLNATRYEQGDRFYYSYDENGNRLYKNETSPQSPYSWRTKDSYNADSSLSGSEERRSGGVYVYWTNYSYDKNGNRLSRLFTDGRRSTTYENRYDLENRLVQVLEIGEVASYAYFSDGSRIRRTTSASGTTYFLYDFRDFNGYNDILEEYDPAGVMKARYIHGPGIDEPLAKQYAGQWYYYHFDGLGSVTTLTDAKHLCSYAGLVPRVAQSGDVTRRGGIHKQGPKALRWIMVTCARAAVKARNSKGRRIYLRLSKRIGKAKAIVAVARRILTVLFALLTQGGEYVEKDPKAHGRKVRTMRRRARELPPPRIADRLGHLSHVAVEMLMEEVGLPG